MASAAVEDFEMAAGLFVEPEDYYPPTPPPKQATYTLKSGDAIGLHIVGHSATEANHLWNGSRVVSEYFETRPEEVRGKTVLELGAGAGLPCLVAAALGARKVVMTDFPDADLVANMWKNIDGCALIPAKEGAEQDTVVAEGYVWGFDSAHLLAHLPDPEAGFDVLVLADLLFRHSEHGRLVDTIEAALRKRHESKAFVFFTSYRPWKRDKDLHFFDVARERGFEVETILEKKMDKPLFEDDPGDVEVLKTVTGFTVRWPEVVEEKKKETTN